MWFRWNQFTQQFRQNAVSSGRTPVMPRNWNNCLINVDSLDVKLSGHCSDDLIWHRFIICAQIKRFNDAFCLKNNCLYWRCFALTKIPLLFLLIWEWTFCSMLRWSEVAMFHHLCTNRLHCLIVPCIWNINLASKRLTLSTARAVCTCHWQCCSAHHICD